MKSTFETESCTATKSFRAKKGAYTSKLRSDHHWRSATDAHVRPRLTRLSPTLRTATARPIALVPIVSSSLPARRALPSPSRRHRPRARALTRLLMMRVSSSPHVAVSHERVPGVRERRRSTNALERLRVREQASTPVRRARHVPTRRSGDECARLRASLHPLRRDGSGLVGEGK